MLVYHTYLAMNNLTTHEHLKDYYDSVPFSPFSSGYRLKNLWERLVEKTPPSMLIPQLLERKEICIHTTKAGLERKNDLQKTILDAIDEEDRIRNQEIAKRRQERFK